MLPHYFWLMMRSAANQMPDIFQFCLIFVSIDAVRLLSSLSYTRQRQQKIRAIFMAL